MRGAVYPGAPTHEETPNPQPRVQGQGPHGGDLWPKDAPGNRRRQRGLDPGEAVEEAGHKGND